jgi:hypothetical protein
MRRSSILEMRLQVLAESDAQPLARCMDRSPFMDRNSRCICLHSGERLQHKKRPCRMQGARPPAASKWLNDCQNDNRDHQDRRYLIDQPIEFVGTAVAIGGKIPHPAGK